MSPSTLSTDNQPPASPRSDKAEKASVKEATANVPKAIIKNVDMSEEMQQSAVDIAMEALSKFTIEKDIAAHVKKTMDTKFGPTWHAVVGQKYGSYVTHGMSSFDLHRELRLISVSSSSHHYRDEALHLLLYVLLPLEREEEILTATLPPLQISTR
jgi:dynein light chain LC8-type